jgi:hypothetical protein
MDFAAAMYNCLLRRMELVAFDTKDEIHSYWMRSNYYAQAMSTGSDFSTNSHFYRHKSILEILHYWTAGAFDESPMIIDVADKRLVWCSTNRTTINNFPRKFHVGEKKRPKCIAFEKYMQRFRAVNCKAKLSFVCEVRTRNS